MSINWVMLDARPGQGFTPLPGEQKLWASPPRTSLSLQSVQQYPGRQPFAVQSSGGQVFLTNRRIVYLPSTATPTFQSFSGPLQDLHDTRVTTPWLGPNSWVAAVQPTVNGGIPPAHAAVELQLTFRDGGAYDFHTKFVAVRERLQQAIDVARENQSGQDAHAARSRGQAVNLDSVHLEQLPAYEEATTSVAVASDSEPTIGSSRAHPEAVETAAAEAARQRESSRGQPVEAPPGYEEVQMQGVAERLERDTRTP